MYILANWWEFTTQTTEQCHHKISDYWVHSNLSLDMPSIFQNKETPTHFLSWQELSIAPESLVDSVECLEASFIGQLQCDVGDADQHAPWIYIVHTDIPADIVDEYNQWYDEEHLPRLVTVTGVHRARRYICEGQSPKYLTAYSLANPDAFESPEGLIARKTPWTAKMRSLFFNTRRTMAKQYDFS